jgi:guanosine-3',5'-bis(diphosphate) 3'-pyrophosphohydrolase
MTQPTEDEQTMASNTDSNAPSTPEAGRTAARVLRAALFAAEKHRHQRRKDADSSPYINHPLTVTGILAQEGGVDDEIVLMAALLHDTLEDTATTVEELEAAFGAEVTTVVLEVTDDKSLPAPERKRLQIEHAAGASARAKLVKLADKIANLRDLAHCPPTGWPLGRKQAYFDWAKAVVDRLRGVHPDLEKAFDREYARRPE